jgi:hypothetical protein
MVHSWLPLSLHCPFLIASFSGLSILDCLFLWIVHSWLPLSLDCSFLIAPIYIIGIRWNTSRLFLLI